MLAKAVWRVQVIVNINKDIFNYIYFYVKQMDYEASFIILESPSFL